MNIPFEGSDCIHPHKSDKNVEKTSIKESVSENYRPEWEKMMKQSVKEIEEGRTHEIPTEELEDLTK